MPTPLEPRERTELPESERLESDSNRHENWKRWGPYLSERQWGTVREDYSEHGTCWDYFTHDMARSRVYRWGEDGLLGITDRQCRLCFSLALWNGRDPILKERLFGLTGPEGNHGEDVKESYFYLDSTPTHSYMKALYKYPQSPFPYSSLLEENRRRGKDQPEFDLEDTGVFDEHRYFDVTAEYAKASPDDILIRITVENRGPERAEMHLLPTLWYRNTWAWGRTGEGYWEKPSISRVAPDRLLADHQTLGRYLFAVESFDNAAPKFLFTDNETNAQRCFGYPNPTPFVKDAFHDAVVNGRADAVNPRETGTKAASHFKRSIEAGQKAVIRLRLVAESDAPQTLIGPDFDSIVAARIQEADEFYRNHIPPSVAGEERNVSRQAYAGLLWSKQFYHYAVEHWLEGDPGQPPPPAARKDGRNRDWQHLYNRDVLSMPDKWEYPWFAAWDLAFHMVPFARIDPAFAKEQLVLMLREWYMHPNGQIPAYEFAFSDVNPPVHAWACFRVYKMTARRGRRDRYFLSRVFKKLLINFTWWVNRKDPEGRHIFSGGFLGLDNIGVFDRSKPLPTGGHLEQADGTAWMAFYSATMLSMAIELAREDPSYEDIASKFFEHFVAISDAMNTLGGTGLWNEEDGFYYDQLNLEGHSLPLKVRSMVGLIPLFAVEVLERDVVAKLPGFSKRLRWFMENRKDLARHILVGDRGADNEGRMLLAIASQDRLSRVLRYLLDETEFLSDHGLRSLSRAHREHPYVFRAGGGEYRVGYVPGDSNTGLFGGNSNWRGPIWFPVNYLLMESLERYHHFFGDSFKVECPTGSGRFMNLSEVASEIARRLSRLFLRNHLGRRPCHGDDDRFNSDPAWKDLLLFHEFFDGDTGRGLGASHQTGWTALAARFIEEMARARAEKQHPANAARQ